MYNFFFDNTGTNTYLVYTLTDDQELDSMSLGQLTNNKIPGIAETSYMQNNNDRIIRYNVSSKVSVKQFFDGSVNKNRLVGVFSSIAKAFLSADDYMLDPRTLLLDTQYIFADVSTCEAVMICLPVDGGQIEKVDVSMFFKNLLFNTQYDQTENTDYVAKIISYLNSSTSFSMSGFKDLLDSISNAKSNSQQRASEQSQKPVQPKQQAQVLTPEKKPPAPGRNVVVMPSTPAKPKEIITPPPETKGEAKQEANMSFLYLMQHYSKENKAIYKAQKDAEKASKEDSSKKGKHEARDKKSNPVVVQQSSFSVPDAGKKAGFAVPGKVSDRENVISENKDPVVGLPTMPVQTVSPSGKSANFGNTTVLSGGMKAGETTVLNAVAVTKTEPFLVRRRNNERIPVNKPVFRIGKEKSYVDYFIGDNSAISRSHANIVTREDAYFVMDTNSTNHTYVNGEMIQSNVETPIDHGAVIRLANEDFEFRLY